MTILKAKEILPAHKKCLVGLLYCMYVFVNGGKVYFFDSNQCSFDTPNKPIKISSRSNSLIPIIFFSFKRNLELKERPKMPKKKELRSNVNTVQ